MTTQNSYLYAITDSYNKIPNSITRFQKSNLFKKWVQKFYLNGDSNLKIEDSIYNPTNYNQDPDYFLIDQLSLCHSNDSQSTNDATHTRSTINYTRAPVFESPCISAANLDEMNASGLITEVREGSVSTAEVSSNPEGVPATAAINTVISTHTYST